MLHSNVTAGRWLRQRGAPPFLSTVVVDVLTFVVSKEELVRAMHSAEMEISISSLVGVVGRPDAPVMHYFVWVVF
jgi:hypothetical protein